MTLIEIPQDQWSEPEKWVWEGIKNGRITDFNELLGQKDTPLDTTKSQSWGKERMLRSNFLKQILLKPVYSNQVTFEGVRIVGALFKENIELENIRLAHQLRLENCRFEGSVHLKCLQINGWFSLKSSTFVKQATDVTSLDLTNAKIDSEFELDGVTICGKLDMNDLDISKSLQMRNGSKFNNVDLIGIKVGGQLSLTGSTVSGKLNMNGLEVTKSLFMCESSNFNEVKFTGPRVGGQLCLIGAMISGKLEINGLNIGESLFMGKKSKFHDVVLVGSRIGGQLCLDGTTVSGRLEMNSIDIVESLFMRENSNFKIVALVGSRVGRQLSFRGATISGELNMKNLDITRDLLMNNGSNFNDVVLKFSKVGCQLNLNDATISGKLNIDNSVVSGEISMCKSTFKDSACLIYSRFCCNLDLSKSELYHLDLTGTKIAGELRLGSDKQVWTRWHKDAVINLSKTSIGAIQDSINEIAPQVAKHLWLRNWCCPKTWEDAWPSILKLDGFTYDRLGEFGDMHKRDVRWYIDWLKRDPDCSPQPYVQLSLAFRAAGSPSKANRILYESRNQARAKAWKEHEYSRWLGSSLLNWSIGYGLGARYFRTLLWVIILTAIGTIFLNIPNQPTFGIDPGIGAKIIYSLDQLLPFVEFEKYNNVKLTGAVAYYFYALKLIGWMLGSFLVAGLAGLTQKT